MLRRFAIVFVVVGMISSVSTAQRAQVQRPTVEQLREAMQKLGWMIGEWNGSGWVESARLGRRAFSYTVDVRSEFGGLVLVVNGVGFDVDDRSTPYAEQVLIEGPPPAVLLGPPGTYSWKELTSSGFLHGNEAQGDERGIQVGFPFSQQDCDRIVDDSYRSLCQARPTSVWSRATASLNDANEWVETREWQRVEGDTQTWNKYFEVILRRVE